MTRFSAFPREKVAFDSRRIAISASVHGSHRDLLARHEEDLPDWQVVRAGDAFAGLQHVAELRIVTYQSVSTRTTSIGAIGRSMLLNTGV